MTDPQKPNKAQEGLEWTAATGVLGTIAAFAPHPLVKLVAAFAAVGTATKAIDCFQATAKDAYRELKQPTALR